MEEEKLTKYGTEYEEIIENRFTGIDADEGQIPGKYMVQITNTPVQYVSSGGTETLWKLRSMDTRLRRVSIILENAAVLFDDDGVFSRGTGNISFNRVNLSPKSLIQGLISKNNGEAFFKQTVSARGKAKIIFKDTDDYFYPYAIESNGSGITAGYKEGRVVMFNSNGSFYCALGTFRPITISEMSMSNLLLNNNKEDKKLKFGLEGVGHVIFRCPCDPSNIEEIKLNKGQSIVVNEGIVLGSVGKFKKDVITTGLTNMVFNSTKLVTRYTATEDNCTVITIPPMSFYGQYSNNERFMAPEY